MVGDVSLCRALDSNAVIEGLYSYAPNAPSLLPQFAPTACLRCVRRTNRTHTHTHTHTHTLSLSFFGQRTLLVIVAGGGLDGLHAGVGGRVHHV